MIALVAMLALRPPAVQVSDLAGLRAAVANAGPGTEIAIAPGEYGAFSASGVRGAEGRPVVLRGADPEAPPRFVSWHLSGVSHIVLRDLEFRGSRTNGLNVDDGGKEGGARHVRIERVVVSDLPQGNNDGIKLSGVEDFRVVDCRVERWGGSAVDMVGCHRGTVEACSFATGGGNGVQAKGGSSDVRIVQCTFVEPGQRGVNLGGSTGKPCFRPAGATWEARGLTVEGCTFFGGVAAVAYVGVDGAAVRLNTIYDPGRWAVRILQETTDPAFVKCRDGVFERNLVVFRSSRWASGGVNVGPGTEPGTFSFRGNFWYCMDAPARSRPALPVAEEGGVYGQDPRLANAEALDVTVREGSPAAKVGAHAYRPGAR